ncbi:hypothetical protein PABG_12356 [Paracoccidioides brasiliensis Pb03]|nr:hypothetical protein PABG_12356 [Paracoccidioides brasiliensis Pb03]
MAAMVCKSIVLDWSLVLGRPSTTEIDEPRQETDQGISSSMKPLRPTGTARKTQEWRMSDTATLSPWKESGAELLRNKIPDVLGGSGRKLKSPSRPTPRFLGTNAAQSTSAGGSTSNAIEGQGCSDPPTTAPGWSRGSGSRVLGEEALEALGFL